MLQTVMKSLTPNFTRRLQSTNVFHCLSFDTRLQNLCSDYGGRDFRGQFLGTDRATLRTMCRVSLIRNMLSTQKASVVKGAQMAEYFQAKDEAERFIKEWYAKDRKAPVHFAKILNHGDEKRVVNYDARQAPGAAPFIRVPEDQSHRLREM